MNLPSLTGLRWWLAIIVFGVHFSETANCMSASPDVPAACGVMNAGFGLGYVVMACFFVLSGFVLTWVAPPRETARRFWQRRIAKVYPLLVLGFVVDLVIRLLAGGDVASLPVLLVNLFLLQTWWPDAVMALQVNPVAWSLSCEAFFYLCFPLIHGYLSRMGNRALRWLFVGLMFWPALMVLVASAAGSDDHGDLLYFFAPTRISEFILGIIAGLLFQRNAWRGFRVGGVLALTVVAYFACFAVAIFLSPAAPALGAVLAPLFALLIVSLARADTTGGWSPVRGFLTVKMGMASYAFYLFHGFVLAGLGPVLNWSSSWQVLSNMVTSMLLCAIVAWTLFRRVELPMQRLLSPRSRLRSAAAATAGTSRAAAGGTAGTEQVGSAGAEVPAVEPSPAGRG